MKTSQKVSLFFLRISIGWLFLYAGITKVLDPAWSAEGFLNSAQTFPSLYAWLAQGGNIEWVNFINEWGLTFIGSILILGIFTRYAAWVGIVFMLLYFLPSLSFPYAGEHGFIVDEHIIYIFAFYVLSAHHSGRYWGLDRFRKRA